MRNLQGQTLREIDYNAQKKIDYPSPMQSQITQESNLYPNAAKGICATCNSVQLCSHWKKYDQAIQFCELFDDYVPANEIQNLISQTEPSAKLKVISDSKIYNGLCMNCSVREGCQLNYRTACVIHCEEYQ